MQAPPRAVLFDAYGTLFDVYSVALLAEQLFPGQGQRLAQLWRDKQIEYSRLVTTSNHGAHYRPFWALTEAALRWAVQVVAPAARQDWAAFEQPAARLLNQYRSLSVFPDVHEVLPALKARGVVTGILSNGDPDMLAVAVRSGGIGPWLDHVISVDAVRLYKTHPAAYALGEQTTGCAPGQTLFVSSNGWDALAASWFGFRTLWVNRHDLPPETLAPHAERSGPSLRAVLEFFPS